MVSAGVVTGMGSPWNLREYNRNDRPDSNIRNGRPVCLRRRRGGPMSPSEVRPWRADARRNRTRVLQAAQQAFATEGLAVPLDEIARLAGVGAGTVYRHFPTKEALFEAVLVDRLEGLVEDARAARGAADAGQAFYAFVTHLVSHANTKKDLADALAGAGGDLPTATL